MDFKGSLKILLIEDREEGYFLIRDKISEIKDQIFVLDFCNNQKEALDLLSKNKYDIYLFDYDSQSFDVLELLRKGKVNGLHHPALLFSFKDAPGLKDLAHEHQFTDFLETPDLDSRFLKRILLNAIEKDNQRSLLSQNERELEALKSFRTLATTISKSFIENQGDELGEGALQALGQLGEFLGMCRCRIYKIDEEKNLSTYRVWENERVQGQEDVLVKLDSHCYPTLMKKLEDREEVVIEGHHNSNIWETEISEFFRSIGLEYVMFCPLIYKEDWVGVLALESAKAVAFNDLDRELITLVAEIISDVMERRERGISLSQVKDEVEKVSKLKSDFLTNMSHELRTPLNSILGMSEILTGTELKEEQREYLAVLMKAANGLKIIFDDIFDYAHLESNSLDGEGQSFLMEDLVGLKISKFESLLKTPLELGYEIDRGGGALGVGAQESLGKILDQLLSNAIKFTNTGSVMVKVSTAQNIENVLEISVTDSGVGIPKEDVAKIFDSFYQSDQSLSSQYPGTGLGLTIVKRILDLLGCEVWIESELGQGTSVKFTFPFKSLQSTL